MEDCAVEPARERLWQLVPPLDLEPVVAQRLVLRVELGALGSVRGQTDAPGSPEAVAGQALQPVEVPVGQVPQRLRPLGSELVPGDIVGGRAAPQREAAVSATGAARDLARL